MTKKIIVGHDFDMNSYFCRTCNMPMNIACDGGLDACNEKNVLIWRAREASARASAAERERRARASREIDKQQLPPGTTLGDIRKALGFDVWSDV